MGICRFLVGSILASRRGRRKQEEAHAQSSMEPATLFTPIANATPVR